MKALHFACSAQARHGEAQKERGKEPHLTLPISRTHKRRGCTDGGLSFEVIAFIDGWRMSLGRVICTGRRILTRDTRL